MSDLRQLLLRRQRIVEAIKPTTVAEERIRQAMLNCVRLLGSGLTLSRQVEQQLIEGWAQLDELQAAHTQQVRERQARPAGLGETQEFLVRTTDLEADQTGDPGTLRLVR